MTSSPSPSPLPSNSLSVSIMDHDKQFLDAIHGHIHISTDMMIYIDTEEFQRLRELKQLGLAHMVFPGATGDRFQHSIGVMYACEQVILHLQNIQPELNITQREIYLIKVSALLHDVLHGPLSHGFELFMELARPDIHFSHEKLMPDFLRYIVPKYHLDLSESEQLFICECIDPKLYPIKSSNRLFLYDIVSNERNSIDFDKEYLLRDCHHLGLKTNVNLNRLIKSSRVIDNQICFNNKEVYNIYEFFHTRYSLFKLAYSHRVAKATELMAIDAFLEADSYMGISKSVDNIEDYMKLTDHILRDIQNSNSQDPGMKRAKEIVLRIRNRDLYQMVEEVILPHHFFDNDGNGEKKDITKSQIIEQHYLECRENNIQPFLEEKHFCLQNLKLGYALKDKNPVDNTQFWHKSNPNKCFKIPKNKVSNMLPTNFQEHVIRIFVKDGKNEKIIEAVQLAFKNVFQNQGYSGKINNSFICPHLSIRSKRKSICLSDDNEVEHNNDNDYSNKLRKQDSESESKFCTPIKDTTLSYYSSTSFDKAFNCPS